MRLLLSLIVCVSFFTLNQSFAAEKPNIIFVLADDLGWSELGCYGNTFNETPHLDDLAKNGLRFTQAYAAAPVCSPYRASLLTGMHPARVGITDYLRPNSANGLSSQFTTLPAILAENGYSTGMIGKWHLTGYRYHGAEFEVRPTDRGFQWNIASEVKGVGNGANFWPYVFRDQPISWLSLPENKLGKDEYLVDRMKVEAVEFIERNRDQPFFLYLSHYATHTILNGKPGLVEKYRKKHPPGKSTRESSYISKDKGLEGDALNHWAGDHNPHLAAMLESVDDGIGLIVKKLKELNLDKNTIIIFTSDNGGETNVTSNAPLRGGKSQLYEGGIRVPLVVSWPEKLPKNQVYEHPTTNVDFFPTLLEVAGVYDPNTFDPDQLLKYQYLDASSQLNYWKNPKLPTEERTFYWHYPLDKPHFLGGRSSGAIRVGKWKLIEFYDTDEIELYDLSLDPSEKNNLANQPPFSDSSTTTSQEDDDRRIKNRERVAELQTALHRWRSQVGATVPSAPLLAEIGNLDFGEHFSPNQISPRWYFSRDWFAKDGILSRADHGTKETRIFLKDAKFQDAVIRFDFQCQQSKDIRLVTGSNGSYNSIIHIRPNHFFIQTAQDKSGPYFSRRHSECAFNFDPNKWYTMTVEFIGDELLAHIDHQHLVYAKHPIIDKERTYFAFQVDQSPAVFDNVQIFKAKKFTGDTDGRKIIASNTNLHPVEKSLDEQLKIAKTNAHDRLYQNDAKYRELVKRVDRLDEENREAYPEALSTHKQYQKRISAQRKKALKEDPGYKELLYSTHRAKRAIDVFLIEQKPSIGELPNSRKKGELEQIRRTFANDERYLALVKASNDAEKKLREAYPQFFITNEMITKMRAEKRSQVEDAPDFKKRMLIRAKAYYAQQDYLFANDPELIAVQKKINAEKAKTKN